MGAKAPGSWLRSLPSQAHPGRADGLRPRGRARNNLCRTAIPAIHDALAAKGLLPAEHLVDCGYTDADNLRTSQAAHQVRIIGRVADDPSWQARAGEGFAKANFLLDWEREVATCPMGKESYSWLPHGDANTGDFQIRFRKKDCTPCASRVQCTKAKVEPRILFMQARAEHDMM